MKKVMLLGLCALLAGCGATEPEVIVVTATPNPATATPVPTDTPPPTNTPIPTATPTPSATPQPTVAPIAISEVEAALREAGYRRFPLTGGDGLSGFTWISDNSYEQVETWEDGTVRLEILHDRSAQVRAEHMERKLSVLDSVFPDHFMSALREAHADYNQGVGPDVSGEPEQLYTFGDDLETVWGEYNVSQSEIMGYSVRFSLWWWQSTCPPEYLYCYYDGFPGLEFTGDSSFIFQAIELVPTAEDAGSGPSA